MEDQDNLTAEQTRVEQIIQEGYIKGLETGLMPRLEIDEFSLDKDMLNLFLIALINLQAKEYKNENQETPDYWSWFQIAGIHGRPFSPWDGVASKPENISFRSAGYCSHSSVTFPTWHRPYMAMMEQAVYAEMLKIANQYEDPSVREMYHTACSRFRFPYWDPCIPRHLDGEQPTHSDAFQTHPYNFGVPLLVSRETVFLRFPKSPDELTPSSNPLHHYDFPEDQRYRSNNAEAFWPLKSNNLLLADDALGGTTHTVRAPDEKGQTDDAYINAYIWRHIQTSLGSSLYKILTTNQKWNDVSNDVYDEKLEVEARRRNTTYIDHTIEGFHDNIHVILGQGKLGWGQERKGSGHIGDPQYAAFDPIFWLHHCNIDRITAIWQAQRGPENRDSWWNETVAGESNWAVPRGQKQTPIDPLIPFRHSKKNYVKEDYWTSDGVRDWTQLGYTYLGKYVQGTSGHNALIPFHITLDKTDAKELNTYVNQFYGWTDIPGQRFPDLVHQFYPINLSQVEALSGNNGPGRHAQYPLPPSYPDRVPTIPNPIKPDYEHMSDYCEGTRSFRQWDIQIIAEKFALCGSYQIFVFLGPFNADEPDGWPTEPNLVGIDGVFSNNPEEGACSNCEIQAEAKLRVMDVIPLTHHLVKWLRSKCKCPHDADDGITLASLQRSDVAPFLKRNFHWRVTDMHLHVVKGDVDFVKVAAVDRLVKLPERYDELVDFGPKNVHVPGEYHKSGDHNGPPKEIPAHDTGYEGRTDGEYGRDGEDRRDRLECCGMKCLIQ